MHGQYMDRRLEKCASLLTKPELDFESTSAYFGAWSEVMRKEAAVVDAGLFRDRGSIESKYAFKRCSAWPSNLWRRGHAFVILPRNGAMFDE